MLPTHRRGQPHSITVSFCRRFTIFVRLVNSGWYLFRRLILLAIISAVALAGYLYVRMDDEIRRYAERFLASHYSELDVRLGGASFVAGQGIVLRDLLISEAGADGDALPLVRIDRMLLRGEYDLESLLAGKTEFDQIVLVRPTLWAARRDDGRWNVAQLFPLPNAGDRSAEFSVEAATVELRDARSPGNRPFVVDGLDVTATTVGSSGNGKKIRVEIQQQSTQTESATATIYIDTPSLEVTGSTVVRGLAVSNELLASLPGIDRAKLNGVDFEAQADISAVFAHHPSRPLNWHAKYQLTGGRITAERLPRPISHVTARGSLSPLQLVVADVSARYGKSRLGGSCTSQDWLADGVHNLQFNATGLPVDNSLRDLLPPDAQSLWDRFGPTGIVDIDATVSGRAGHLRPEDVEITCYAASFTDYERFPYRVDQATGNLHYTIDGDHGQLDIHLDAIAAGRPVSIRGQLFGLPTTCAASAGSLAQQTNCMPPGWIEINCAQLPIHERLLAALPDRSETDVRSLSPTGHVTLGWRIERGPNDIDQAVTKSTVLLHDCEIRYAQFRYPLTHVNGTLTEHNGHWSIDNVTSQLPNQGRIVRCSGKCLTYEDGLVLQLDFNGQAVPLDSPLRVALPDHLREIWDEFRPSGLVDFASRVDYRTGDELPRISLTVKPHQRTVSIEPVFFPYRLDQLDGVIVYRNGIVTLTDIRAMHGRTSLSAAGVWSPTSLGGWRLVLEKLSIDRLTPSRDLMLAAPPALWKVIDSLKPSGSFAIHDGRVLFEQPSRGSTQFTTEWNLKLDCHQADLDVGVDLDHVSGMVHLEGRSDETGSFTDGELIVDSAFWQGIQLTNIRGPLRVEKDLTALGIGASKRMGLSPRRIEANLSGGQLSLNAFVRHGGRTRYDLSASIADVDFGRLMREQFGSTTDLAGKIEGQVTVGGTGRSIDLMQGGGYVKLSDANIGELNFMVALLKVLRNRAPDTNAFDACEANFELNGKQIKFDQLNLFGDAVSLYGRGEATFDRELNLVFHSLVGRSELNVPVLRSLMGSASEQIMQIEVSGTFDDPITHRRALPAVSSLIEQLGSEGISPTNPENASRASTRR